MATLYNIKGKKVLFIHIPKTGGSSIGSVLKPYEMGVKNLEGHQGYEECLKRVKPDEVFTVVRNPWDWRASWYHYVKNDKNGNDSGCVFEHRKSKNQSFNEHLDWLENESKKKFTISSYAGKQVQVFIKPQSKYIEGCDNIKILRFENLKKDFEDYMLELGLPLKLNKHERKSNNNNYKNMYGNKNIDVVKKLWCDDINNFNYEY